MWVMKKIPWVMKKILPLHQKQMKIPLQILPSKKSLAVYIDNLLSVLYNKPDVLGNFSNEVRIIQYSCTYRTSICEFTLGSDLLTSGFVPNS